VRRKGNIGGDRGRDVAESATSHRKVTTDAALLAVVRALARIAAEESLSPLSSLWSGAPSGMED